MGQTATLPEDKLENLIKAYRLLYETVVARKTKEILEKIKMEEKEYGGEYQRI